jgi:acetyl-CoA synthetase
MESSVIPPPKHLGHSSHLNVETFDKMYKESIDNPEGFFGKQASTLLEWIRPFDKVKHGYA